MIMIKKESIWKHPLAMTFIGLILTGIIGSFFGFVSNTNAYREKVDLLKQQVDVCCENRDDLATKQDIKDLKEDIKNYIDAKTEKK